MGLRKGDTVMIIAGREKGKTGTVQRIDREAGRIWVEKLNMVKRHQRPTQKLPQGGIVEKEAGLAISNVMLYDPKAAKPTRFGIKIQKDGKKVRVSKRTGEVLEAKA